MSWEISGNSSVVEAPLILAEVNCDGESIASKLQSLALKASPQVQKEIEDVLSSLSGESRLHAFPKHHLTNTPSRRHINNTLHYYYPRWH